MSRLKSIRVFLAEHLLGRVTLPVPLVCGHCGHVKSSLSRQDVKVIALSRRSRLYCGRDGHPMSPRKTTDHQVARAAAYYTERGMEP